MVVAAEPLAFRIHPVAVTEVVERRVVPSTLWSVVGSGHAGIPLSNVMCGVPAFLELCGHPRHIPRYGSVGVARARELGEHVDWKASRVE